MQADKHFVNRQEEFHGCSSSPDGRGPFSGNGNSLRTGRRKASRLHALHGSCSSCKRGTVWRSLSCSATSRRRMSVPVVPVKVDLSAIVENSKRSQPAHGSPHFRKAHLSGKRWSASRKCPRDGRRRSFSASGS